MKDLFGENVDIRDDFERDLAEYDKFTFQDRVERLKYLNKIYPPGTRMMSMSMYYLFQEVKYTFINGLYAATVMLSLSIIEHWSIEELKFRGYDLKNKRPGINDVMNCLKENNLLHPFLVEKIENLRRIRNPFVHYRKMEDAENLDHRSVDIGIHHFDLAEKDAKEALAVMYEVLQRIDNLPRITDRATGL